MFGIINHFKNRIAFLTHNISQMYYDLKEKKKHLSEKKASEKNIIICGENITFQSYQIE